MATIPTDLAVQAESSHPPKTMTYEEFLAWAGEDTHAEWVNGEVIEFMPPMLPHQSLIEFLYQLISLFITIANLGELRVAPFELKITPEGNSREPDLMFISKANLNRLSDKRFSGPPDLIIEIVSNDSVHRDRVDKLDEYEAGSVPEYWIIDNRPGQHRAWFYQLDSAGHYQSIALETDGVYRSKTISGFWLRVEWLWAEKPNILRALAEVIGPERIAQSLQDSLN